jgi:hypothetical protein
MLQDVDTKIISHPANCKFLQYKDIARKTFKNLITLKELYNKAGKMVRLTGIEPACPKDLDFSGLAGYQLQHRRATAVSTDLFFI